MKEVMAGLYYFIIHSTAPLYRVVYQGSFFFIDYWSFVHFISGASIMTFLTLRGYRRHYMTLTGLLVFYEVVEFLFLYLAVNIFRPEIIPDQFTDIAMGFSGGLAARKMLAAGRAWRQRQAGRRGMSPDFFVDLSLPLAVALAWVGSYGYAYNISFLNSPFVNWFALLLWWIWLTVTIRMHRVIEAATGSFFGALPLTWGIYFGLLLAFEYVGYYILGIRLITSEGPLIFGVIHGSSALKTFYVGAGVFSVALSRIVRKTVAGRSSYVFCRFRGGEDVRSSGKAL